MMKKLLVLALVLSVAGLVNAGISLEKTSDTTAALISTDATAYNAYITIEQGKGVVDLMLTGNAGGLGGIGVKEEYGDGHDWILITVGGTPTAPAGAGQQLIASLTSGAPTTIQLFDSFGTTALSAPIVLGIPEPMTMLLLGLGGLFLRRK